MTPEQSKSCTWALNALSTIVSERTFFNTNARVDLVTAFRIINALLEEDLLTKERCVEFDRAIASMGYQFERPYFSKFKTPMFGALHQMSPKARMTLFRKLKGYLDEFSVLSVFTTQKQDDGAYLELFITRYGGDDHMRRFLIFV